MRRVKAANGTQAESSCAKPPTIKDEQMTMEDRENAEKKILRFVIAARERENSIKSDIFAKIYAPRNLRGLPRILMLLMFFF